MVCPFVWNIFTSYRYAAWFAASGVTAAVRSGTCFALEARGGGVATRRYTGFRQRHLGSNADEETRSDI